MDIKFPIAKSGKNRRLSTAAETVTAVVMEEDVLDAMEAAEAVHVSPKAMTGQKAFLRAMRTVCYVSTEDFGNLVEMYKRQGGKDVSYRVDQLLHNSL